MYIKTNLMFTGIVSICLLPFFKEIWHEKWIVALPLCFILIYTAYMISTLLSKYMYILGIKYFETDGVSLLSKKITYQITSLLMFSVLFLAITVVLVCKSYIPILCLYTMSANIVCCVDVVVCKNKKIYIYTNGKVQFQITKIEIINDVYKLYFDSGVIKVYKKNDINEQAKKQFAKYIEGSLYMEE